MSNISDTINAYFIEMVSSDNTKEQMKKRLVQHPLERDKALPTTDSLSDAFYVVLGCKFQDNPTQSVLLALCFIVAVGLFIANLLTKLVG